MQIHTRSILCVIITLLCDQKATVFVDVFVEAVNGNQNRWLWAFMSTLKCVRKNEKALKKSKGEKKLILPTNKDGQTEKTEKFISIYCHNFVRL